MSGITVYQFGDPEKTCNTPVISLQKTVTDALIIAKIGRGICQDSVLDAIKAVFIEGAFPYSEICAEFKAIVPSEIEIPLFYKLEESFRDAMLSQRQLSTLAGSFSEQTKRTKGYEKFEEEVDADLRPELEKAGITKEALLGRLQMMMNSEDDRTAMKAIEKITKLMGLDEISAVHSDRRKTEARAKIRIAARAFEQTQSSTFKSTFEIAANEAYRMREKKRSKNKISDAEIIE